MKNITSLALACAVTGTALGAVTDPVGYYSKTLTTEFNFVGTGLANPVDYSGALDSLYTDTGAFTAGSFDQGAAIEPQFYLEIAEGPNEGARIDIISNTADTLTVDPAGSAAFSAFLDGSTKAVIRKHMTLNDVFGGDGTSAPVAPNELQIDGGTSPGAADNVLIWNGVSYDIYYYNTFFIGTGWTGPNADGGNLVIPPGTGVIVQDNVNPGNTITVEGAVKVTNTLIPLPEGYSLVCSPVAIDRTFSNLFGGGDGTPAPADLVLTPNTSPGPADNVLTWNGTGYDTFFYNNFFIGTGWSPSEQTVLGSDAVFVEVKAGNGDTVASMDFYDEDAGTVLPPPVE